MKRFLLAAMLLGLTTEGAAQDGALYLSSRQPPVRISVGALYQSYSDGSDISEVSIPLAVSIPVGAHLGVSLTASQASVTGDDLEALSGISDAQVGLSYYRQVGQGSVVVSLGVNLPSGKRELTTDEFETSVLLSRHEYNFRVPGFGQGLNLAPGIVWAFPVGEDVVLGLGASYQRKGGFRPLADVEDDFDPGDEILLTGGLDYRVGAAANLSADVTYTRYGGDTLGDEDVYSAGDKVTATAQWLGYLQQNELRVVARFRSQARSTRPAVLGAADEALRALPAQFSVLGSYRHRLDRTWTLGVLAGGRVFGETDFFDAATLVDVGVAPEVALSPGVALRTRFLYTLGDITGFEAGGGLAVEL